jgi:hypothetical protein
MRTEILSESAVAQKRWQVQQSTDVEESEAPWALAIGLAVIAWNAVNLLLTARFLARSPKPLA